MNAAGLKEDLHRYLRDARTALLWKLDGLSEYDLRRPLTPHGTNLLGLVKHLSGCEIGYVGYVFARPFPHPPTWLTDDSEPNVDMWAAPEETSHDIRELYQRACQHSDATINALNLDYHGTVPTWPEPRRSVTLHQILVHMLAETTRHAGHADIVRELIDNAAGMHPDRHGFSDTDPDYWPQLRRRIERAARDADTTTPTQTVSLRPMTDNDYNTAAGLREAEALRELTKQMPQRLAEERVRHGTTQLLPDGRHTPDHHLVVAVNDHDAVVGHAWIGPDPRATATPDGAWLYDIFIHPPFRRHGYGTALLTAIEDLAIQQGRTHLALNVAGDNTTARNLYQRNGYTVTSQYLRKILAHD